MDATGPGETFATLLRRHRVAAGLSQEMLAGRAGLSPRGIGDLERGVKTAPHRDTVALLATALELSAAERSALEAAVIRQRGPRTPPIGRPGADGRGGVPHPLPPLPDTHSSAVSARKQPLRTC